MTSTTVRFDGRQIALRDWRVSDLARNASWLEPGHRWKELDGPYYPLPTAEETAAFVARKRAEIESGAFPHPRSTLAIADKATDEFQGLVSWSWESQETQWLSVGLVIFDPAYWGQGRGYEALGLWSDYLFQALPSIVRLDLRTWSGNRGMMRLAEKLGYQLEARFRQARIVEGLHYDGLGYGVLRDEWERRYPAGFAAHLASEGSVEHAAVDDESRDLPHERVLADSRAAGMLTPEAEEEAAALSDADFIEAQERYDRGERW